MNIELEQRGILPLIKSLPTPLQYQLFLSYTVHEQ